MDILDLKYRYHTSMNKFGYSSMISVALLLYILLRGENWMICFVPTIILFCVIGLVFVSKGLLVLSEKDGNTTEMTEDEYLEKLYGVQGFRLTFVVLAIIIAACMFFVLFLYFPKALMLEKLNYASLGFLAIISFIIYTVSKELSFVIMSVTILKTAKTENDRLIKDDKIH